LDEDDRSGDVAELGGAVQSLQPGGAALRQWADRAVEALNWSESSGSSFRNVRERMVHAAKERFLADYVVDK
jgi:hypothetical protein